MTNVKFFLDHRGKNPVGDFLDENKEIKIKASIIIKNIIEFGLISAIPHIKKLSGFPLWEIRIMGKDSSRILYANKIKDEIILLHAFKKKTNKTPTKEINTALNHLRQLSWHLYPIRYNYSMKLLTFDQYFTNSLKDPEFKNLWEKSEPKYQLSRQIIKKRLAKKMSQQELAKKSGTTQAVISRLENSTFNPSLELLERISFGLGSKLNVQI